MTRPTIISGPSQTGTGLSLGIRAKDAVTMPTK